MKRDYGTGECLYCGERVPVEDFKRVRRGYEGGREGWTGWTSGCKLCVDICQTCGENRFKDRLINGECEECYALEPKI